MSTFKISRSTEYTPVVTLVTMLSSWGKIVFSTQPISVSDSLSTTCTAAASASGKLRSKSSTH